MSHWDPTRPNGPPPLAGFAVHTSMESPTRVLSFAYWDLRVYLPASMRTFTSGRFWTCDDGLCGRAWSSSPCVWPASYYDNLSRVLVKMSMGFIFTECAWEADLEF